MAGANRLLARTLAERPLEVEIGAELLPVDLPLRLPALRARVTEVRVRPARPGRVGFAIRVEIGDSEREIAALALGAEVAPEVVREGGGTRLEIGLGPDNLLAVEPELGAEASGRLADALARWLPAGLRGRVPRAVLERSARELARRLTGAVYRALRAALLGRLGEVARIRLRLPDLPIARVAIRSSTSPAPALEIDLVTELPVRAGLGEAAGAEPAARPLRAPPVPAPAASEAIQLRLAGSTVAEIGNWAIDRGLLPQRYTRNLQPRADGAYRPFFDWRGGGSPRPLAIHIFQERGGCSYFEVRVRPEVSLAAGSLVVALRDREIESARGPALLELAVWLRSLVTSAADTTRRMAAATELEVGGRRFATRVTRAALAGDELLLDLEVSPLPTRLDRVRHRSTAPAAARHCP